MSEYQQLKKVFSTFITLIESNGSKRLISLLSISTPPQAYTPGLPDESLKDIKLVIFI